MSKVIGSYEKTFERGLKMKSKATLRIFKTYISYLILSALLLIPSYFQCYKILQEREYSSATSVVMDGVEVLENQINSLIELSNTTNNDNRYRKLFVKNAPAPPIAVSEYVPLNQVQGNFRTLLGMQPLVKDAGIYFDEQTVITRHRSIVNYPLSYYSEFFKYGDIDGAQWAKLLSENARGGILPAAPISSADYQNYNGITFVCAWPPTLFKNYHGLFYAILDSDSIVKQMLSPDVIPHGFVRLYSQSHDGPLLLDYQYDQKLDGQIITYSSDRFYVEVGIPNAIFNEHLRPMRDMLLLLLVVSFIIALGLALYFSYHNSLPIRKLAKAVSHVNAGAEGSNPQHNEYDYIANAVTRLEQTANNYAEMVQAQRNTISLHLLSKAFNDGLYSAQLQSEFQKSFADFPDFYQLCSVSYSLNSSDSLDGLIVFQLSLIDDIEVMLTGKIYTHVFEDENVVLVLPLKHNDCDNCWDEPLIALHTQLTNKYDMDFCIAISEQFSSVEKLSEAYSQLRSINLCTGEDFASLNSGSVLHKLNDFQQRSPNLAMDFSSMQQFYAALMVGDAETTDSILSANLKSLRHTGYVDEMFIKQIFYNFRNVLLRVKVEHSDATMSVAIPGYDPRADISELFASLTECGQKICNAVSEQRESSKAQFSDNVLAFIKDNISNNELYTKMAAAHFGISETTLQKTIHNATGKTFFEFVEDMRLELAYDLLKNTDQTINNVAVQCGFSSHNSFYKAFKRRYGQPPGSIRK